MLSSVQIHLNIYGYTCEQSKWLLRKWLLIQITVNENNGLLKVDDKIQVLLITNLSMQPTRSSTEI